MRDRRFVFLVVLVVLMMVCIALAVREARAEDFHVTASLSLGLSTVHVSQFIDMNMAASYYGFTLYGGVLTDVIPVEAFAFVPIRSIYTMGFKYQWEWLTLGWYHECTHRGDGSTLIDWYSMRQPTENNLYVTFTFER